jgi:hypothetical protein
MGKRSDFERRAMDDYPTPPEAVTPLLRHLSVGSTFCEPCAGEGKLIAALERAGMKCVSAFDAAIGPHPRIDVSFMHESDLNDANYIITNPPWEREALHQIIMRCALFRPTWLLFDADWAHTQQAIPYLEMCSMIIAVGRVKWIEGTKHAGKDNACWYLFDAKFAPTRPIFYGNR